MSRDPAKAPSKARAKVRKAAKPPRKRRLDGPQVICTLGPVFSNAGALRVMANVGMTVLRVNCSHYDRAATFRLVTELRRTHPAVKILMDLQGPKIRVAARFRERALRTGEPVVFVDAAAPLPFDAPSALPVPLALFQRFALLKDARTIFMKDCTMEFEVRENCAERGYILAQTRLGGVVREEKAVHFPGLCAGVPAITAKDREDVRFALDVKADIVMASFVNRAADMHDLRAALGAGTASEGPLVWAKIETRSGVENLAEICAEADAILVGRGDLWVEVGALEASAVQSLILQTARRQKIDCYVATQVLESMRNNPVPTRSEMRDIYLSIEEGARGFMLTAETSVGKYPLEAIQVLRQLLERYAGVPTPAKP